MKTILQVIPNMGAGGAEQAVVDVAAALVARGDRALVVSRGGARVPELEKVGAVHFTHNVASKNPVKIIQNGFWLAALALREGVDLLHVRSRAPAWSVRIAASRAHLPSVTTFHAAYKFKSRLKKYYNRIMTRADRIIAISAFIAKHVTDNYHISSKKIRIVPRGIDGQRFAPEAVTQDRREALAAVFGINPAAKIILVPARLSPIKGQDLVIKALALMPHDAPFWQAVILGDDQGRKAYRAQLEALIAEKGLGDRVHLVAHCADMPAAYSLADLVLVPSLVPEGFGRVPVEAMAMGVPVIASALGATVETVVPDETGWLLPPEYPTSWATAIQNALRLSEAARAEMSQKGMAIARAQFSKRQMIDKTLAVYDELLG